MKHKTQARYPASSDVVIKAFMDKAFHLKKLEALKLPKYQVLEAGGDGKTFRIRVERHVPVDAPGPVKKFIPAQTRAINEEVWNLANKTGRVTAEPQGVPVEISCNAVIKDDAKGCVVHYDWDIKARVPLVGGLLEKFVAGDMENRAAEEARVSVPFLKDYQ